jgi:Flp pilus assembly protein TadG
MISVIKMRRRCPKRGWDEGATVVEAALIFSALMLLLFGIVQFSYALWQWNTMMLVVQDWGRYAMINNQTCGQSCIQNKMQTDPRLTSSVCTTPSAGQICVYATPPTGTTPPTMTLTAAYNFNLVSPFIPSFTMMSQALVPLD